MSPEIKELPKKQDVSTNEDPDKIDYVPFEIDIQKEDPDLTAAALNTGIDFGTDKLFIVSLVLLIIGLGFKFIR